MFRTVFLSIIRRSRLYIQQQAYVKQILLTAGGFNVEIYYDERLYERELQVQSHVSDTKVIPAFNSALRNE